MTSPSQGIHLVLDASFQPGPNAIMVPHTDDGRVLFLIPWHGRVLVGTTDTPMPSAEIEPRALPEEIEFVLRNAGRFLAQGPGRGDVLSVLRAASARSCAATGYSTRKNDLARARGAW